MAISEGAHGHAGRSTVKLHGMEENTEVEREEAWAAILGYVPEAVSPSVTTSHHEMLDLNLAFLVTMRVISPRCDNRAYNTEHFLSLSKFSFEVVTHRL